MLPRSELPPTSATLIYLLTRVEMADLGQAQRRDGPAAGAAPGVPVLQGARGTVFPAGAGLSDGLHRLRSPAYTARGGHVCYVFNLHGPRSNGSRPVKK